jgi:hypothetical protein
VVLPTARAVKSFLPLVSEEEAIDRVSVYRLFPLSVRKSGLFEGVPRQDQRQKIQVDIVRLGPIPITCDLRGVIAKKRGFSPLSDLY